MNLVYMGLIEFPQEFVINGEVLGKEYVTQIGDTNVLIRMPVLDSDSGRKLEILKSPIQSFEFNIDWGYVVHTKTKDSFVKAAVLIFKGDENSAQALYTAFPNWLYRFMTIVRASSHDLTKEYVVESLQHDSDGKTDKYTGLLLYRLVGSKMTYECNADKVITAYLGDSLIYNTGISDLEMKDIMKYAGSTHAISQGFFLLSEAAIAYQRGDNTSCVILSSMALEEGILERINKHRKENNIKATKTGPLGKKFKILSEYGIDIPIEDYKSRIVEFRNDVIHLANKVTESDARRYWKDCQLIMKEYTYPMVTE